MRNLACNLACNDDDGSERVEVLSEPDGSRKTQGPRLHRKVLGTCQQLSDYATAQHLLVRLAFGIMHSCFIDARSP